jgi:chromosome partitioning protein
MNFPIVLIANAAGGVGKTTLTHCISAAAAEYGKKVLAIDCDPQATLTFRCGIENPRLTSAEVFSGEHQITNAIVKTMERFTLLPGASRLASQDLKNVNLLNTLNDDFDLCIIDTPSGPSSVLSALMAVATYVVIPVNSSFHSIRGALHIRDFQRNSGVSPTMRLVMNNSDDPTLDETVTHDFTVLEPALPRALEVKKAEITTQSVLSFASHAQISSDIRELSYSLLEELGQF